MLTLSNGMRILKQCSCDNLPGTSLAKDNHTCHSGGGCMSENGGCSHQCIDSYNQVFCMCPDGFLLDSDWKTCLDVDECENDNMGCDQICVNTPGSFKVGDSFIRNHQMTSQ